MSLKEQLTADMKQAMKDKEAGKVRLSVIRMVRSALRNAEIDQKIELGDPEIIEIIVKEVKMRRDSIDEFNKGNRSDLVDQAEKEINVLIQYLPQQLTEDELRMLVQDTITEIGASSVKDMGKVMSCLMPKIKGRADGKLVNVIVRELLQA